MSITSAERSSVKHFFSCVFHFSTHFFAMCVCCRPFLILSSTQYCSCLFRSIQSQFDGVFRWATWKIAFDAMCSGKSWTISETEGNSLNRLSWTRFRHIHHVCMYNSSHISEFEYFIKSSNLKANICKFARIKSDDDFKWEHYILRPFPLNMSNSLQCYTFACEHMTKKSFIVVVNCWHIFFISFAHSLSMNKMKRPIKRQRVYRAASTWTENEMEWNRNWRNERDRKWMKRIR